MIVLAADQVGLQVTEFLARRHEAIDWLVLDAADRGGCNAEIRRAAEGASGNRRVEPAESLSDPAFIRAVSDAKPRLGVLAWWPHLLRGPMMAAPELGWLNLHPGYLPYNRGKYPNFWCLVDETPCGAALHFIDRGADTGPVIARARIDASWEDTGQSVHRKCRKQAVQLFRDNLDAVLSGAAKPMAQAMTEGTAHRAAEIDAASEIDLDKTYTARELLNVIRARMFPPHPTASFRDAGKKYSVQVVIKETPE